MRKTKITAAATLPMAGLRGLLSGFAAAIVLLAIAALFVSKGIIPQGFMRIVAAICALSGALVGGFIAAKSAGAKRLLIACGVGFVMFLVCFLSSAISGSADFPSMWHLVLLSVFVGGGVIGGMLAARAPSRRR